MLISMFAVTITVFCIKMHLPDLCELLRGSKFLRIKLSLRGSIYSIIHLFREVFCKMPISKFLKVKMLKWLPFIEKVENADVSISLIKCFG